jgi:hypothetical protein
MRVCKNALRLFLLVEPVNEIRGHMGFAGKGSQNSGNLELGQRV